MLGEHGEAYVLDWGLARVTGGVEGDSQLPSSPGAPDATVAGDLMGTIGYMSPEQARGEVVDTRTDVFALGCILFEILTGQHALPRGIQNIEATIDCEALIPSDRGNDVPPELDKLCARATAQDRGKRPSARQLADGVQAYLDGDRDQAARREAAAKMVATASEAFARVVAGNGGDADRALAMREAGRALALEPLNQTALDITAYLTQVVPDQLPPEALAAADAERGLARQKVAIWARGAIGMLLVIELGLLFVPLHHVWPVLLMIGVTIPVWVVTYFMGKRPLSMSSGYFPVFTSLVALAILAAGIVLGPLFVLPLFIIGGISGFVAQPTTYSPWYVVAGLQLPVVALVILETVGVLPSTFEFRDGSFVLTTWVFDLTPTVAAFLLVSALVVQTINSTLIALFQRKAQEAAQNRVHAHQWHLQKLLPDGSQRGAELASREHP
jgi:serine/threonine-protein kinase